VRRQMRFVSPEGRGEVVWVEDQADDAYRVLNVPVWIYGISLGSLVEGTAGDDLLVFRKLLEPAPGGTVRCIVPKGTVASSVYLTKIVPDAIRLGIGIGPATFLDPRMVAIHLHVKDAWWPAFGEYLNRLVDEGVLQEWEVADPDEYADDHSNEVTPWNGRDLVHPEPDTDVSRHFSL
jgi:Domain of unknown function (DUF4265)